MNPVTRWRLTIAPIMGLFCSLAILVMALLGWGNALFVIGGIGTAFFLIGLLYVHVFRSPE